ncbi:hypothetical protein H257_17266 [Aphanomyces astaci]|uniref:HTH CENPB-type domain-containing protein n=1 Tax=Aphanomyces astaci TaxID=112090 RepID=W4FH86_APHAT|nr:hypothetical protein H257_17266 [Aphanomyces astaci]ETV66224.1 hypothetical protein H257_17266 [Aphanomyces astaci]|eukprot:XP_009844293.1 hypothetical protein H257_17266 [Aphanomyces astaci]
MTSVKPKKQYRRYTNRDRKCLLAHFHASPLQDEAKFCADMQIARSTWRGWRNNEQAILRSKRHGSKGSLRGQGRKTIIPFKDALLAYIDECRDEEKFVHMMRWIRRNQHEWLTHVPEHQEERLDRLRLSVLPSASVLHARTTVPTSPVRQQAVNFSAQHCISPILYVHGVPPRQRHDPTTDVKFQPSYRPSGRLGEQWYYFSGKPKLYGLKIEASMLA